MIKTKEPSPEMAEASRPSGFRAKRRSWREDAISSTSTPEPTPKHNNFLSLKHSGSEQTDSKRITNGEQTDNKRITNGEQTDNKWITNGEQTDNKRVSKPVTNGLTNGEQTDNKRITKSSFFELIGLQRKVTLYIYDSCKLTRSDISSAITLEAISINLGIPKGSVKTTTNRLRKKCVIETVFQKEGRGGFTKYRLDNTIYQEILRHETDNNRITNGEQTDNKRVSKPITQPITSLSSSSLLSVNASTQLFRSTTTSPDLENPEETSASNQLPADWEDIDYLGLESIKFGKTHLLQLYTRKYCDSKAAQESIWHFAFYIKTPASKTLKHPIAYLMSVMSRDKYFSRPDGYLTPEEEAQQKRIDQQKKEIERRQIRESQFFELVFEEYFLNLSAKKIRELSPTITNQEGTKIIIRNLFFREHWLEITEAFRQGLSVEQFLMPDTLTQTESEKSEPELSREEIRKIVDQQFGKVREDF